VYKLTDEIAIINTADFITPPVDDPFVFGQIAAANSISDVYAMGGKPVTCLNLVCFPAEHLGPEVLHGIVAGALDKITESGAVLAGGHTVDDADPKFGLSVTGVVHPDRVWTNIGARDGDALIVTKPIGSGVMFNAQKKGKLDDEAAFAKCIDTVTALNKTAAEVFAGYEVHACTDVTGFGFAGHAMEMAQGSEAALRIELDKIPVLPRAYDMYAAGVSTGVNAPNRAKVEPHLRFEDSADEAKREILFDPQTSGGLLVALPAGQAHEVLAKLHDAGLTDSAIIGHTIKREGDTHLVIA
jgi:selenide,water dikinase